MIVDTYGVPTYKEANPVIVSFVTFPFLFGMMFGDMGHGSLLLMVGIYMTVKGNEDGGMAGKLRYILLLMGMFAVYCGLIYNEFFALPINLFTSCYMTDPEDKLYAANVKLIADPDVVPLLYDSPRTLWHPSQS